MKREMAVFMMVFAGCATSADETDVQEQEATDAETRVYNIVDVVLPAGNHDGAPGNECVALLNPEHRLRSVILVESVAPGATCALSAYAAGDAVSFTWGDTSAYSDNAGRPLVRAAVGDSDGAVHRLSGTATSEAPALAALTSFLALPDATQGTQLLAIEGKRVHSIYDFEGDEEVAAEAAYQAVRVTQTCEQPGTPRLDARYADGFVRGYVASNSGSCHSGWFSRTHVYNREWRLVASYEYSE
jgi:hypothetical protein